MVFVTPGFETCRRHFGQDFLAFYVAGSLAAEGRAHDLYDLDVIRAREQHIARDSNLALGDAIGPWWNPPVYAWLFAPLSRLPFGAALLVWTGVNLAAMAAAVILLRRLVPEHKRLLTTLVLASAPYVQSLTHGQNTPISLLLVAAVAHAWRNHRPFAAGALSGLLLYKPQLAAALAGILVLHRGRRAAGGLLAVGAIVLVATVVTMPGAIQNYLHQLPLNLDFMQAQHTYLWERHVTLRAFWRLLLQGRGRGVTAPLTFVLTTATAMPFAAALVLKVWRARRAPETTDSLIAATVVAAPLLMPFYFDYDLLLLAVPAAFSRGGARTAALWGGLYVWLFVNPYVGAYISINLAVPLLAGIASMTLARVPRTSTGLRSNPVTPQCGEFALRNAA